MKLKPSFMFVLSLLSFQTYIYASEVVFQEYDPESKSSKITLTNVDSFFEQVFEQRTLEDKELKNIYLADHKKGMEAKKTKLIFAMQEESLKGVSFMDVKEDEENRKVLDIGLTHATPPTLSLQFAPYAFKELKADYIQTTVYPTHPLFKTLEGANLPTVPLYDELSMKTEGVKAYRLTPDDFLRLVESFKNSSK